MRIFGLSLLFLAVLILQGIFLTEAFGTSPGTAIQMAANNPPTWIVVEKEKAPAMMLYDWDWPSW